MTGIAGGFQEFRAVNLLAVHTQRRRAFFSGTTTGILEIKFKVVHSRCKFLISLQTVSLHATVVVMKHWLAHSPP